MVRISAALIALLCSGVGPNGARLGVSGTAFDVPAAPECAAGSCRDDGEPGRHEASVSRMRRAVLELGDTTAPVSSLWAESQRALRNSLLHDDVRGFRRWQSVAGMFESAPMVVRQHGDLTLSYSNRK